jgi:hypothetical protein
MKTQIITAVMLFCFLSSFGQGNLQDIIDKRDSLLKRSKIEKSGAFIPLSFGTASLVGGIIVLSRVDGGLEDLDKALGGTALFIVGVGVTGIGIVQLIRADKKMQKANRFNLDINKPVVIYMGLAKKVLPYSVGIGIPIN